MLEHRLKNIDTFCTSESSEFQLLNFFDGSRSYTYRYRLGIRKYNTPSLSIIYVLCSMLYVLCSMFYALCFFVLTQSKKKYIYRLCSLLFVLSSINLSAQDIHFSDFYATPLNTNPALTGVFRGNTRIMGILRDQYRAVTLPYQTVSVGFDTRKDKIMNTNNALGFGAIVNADVAGDSKFGTYQFVVPFALHQYSYGSKLHLTYGISLGFTANTIDYENLRYPEEFEGDRYVENTFIDESQSNTLNSYFSLGLGVNARYNFNDITGLSGGLSLFNVNNPNPTLQGDDNVRTRRRMMLHTMFRRKIAETVEVLPSAKIQFQGSFQEFQFGGQIAKYFDNLKLQRIHVGSWFRAKNKDAVILNLGFEIGAIQLGFSYDVNISKLQEASDNRGGFEISLIYIYTKRKSSKKRSVKCPGYF